MSSDMILVNVICIPLRPVPLFQPFNNCNWSVIKFCLDFCIRIVAEVEFIVVSIGQMYFGLICCLKESCRRIYYIMFPGFTKYLFYCKQFSCHLLIILLWIQLGIHLISSLDWVLCACSEYMWIFCRTEEGYASEVFTSKCVNFLVDTTYDSSFPVTGNAFLVPYWINRLWFKNLVNKIYVRKYV